MSELIFVTTDNCELCKKAENKIKFLKPFYQIRKVDVQEDHKEFLLRVPVLLKNNKIIRVLDDIVLADGFLELKTVFFFPDLVFFVFKFAKSFIEITFFPLELFQED